MIDLQEESELLVHNNERVQLDRNKTRSLEVNIEEPSNTQVNPRKSRWYSLLQQQATIKARLTHQERFS